MPKVVCISGASSGVGRAAALHFRDKGWIVYDLSRSGASFDSITHIKTDVTCFSEVEAAIARIDAEQGRLDVFIINAGFGISGAAEFCDAEAIKRLVEVNFFGADNCARAAIPLMRRNGGGKLLFTGSVAGAISIPFQTYYSVTKAALNSYARGLTNELRPFGISAASLMLGDTRTGFTGKREKAPAGAEVYGGVIERSVARMEKDEQNGMPPERAARFFYKIANKRSPKPLYAVGGLNKLFLFAEKILPVRLVSRLVYMIYAR